MSPCLLDDWLPPVATNSNNNTNIMLGSFSLYYSAHHQMLYRTKIDAAVSTLITRYLLTWDNSTAASRHDVACSLIGTYRDEGRQNPNRRCGSTGLPPRGSLVWYSFGAFPDRPRQLLRFELFQAASLFPMRWRYNSDILRSTSEHGTTLGNEVVLFGTLVEKTPRQA